MCANRAFIACVLGSLALPAAALAQSVQVSVPGTANPWLAGMPAGTGLEGDIVPNQSPVLVPLAGSGAVSFASVTGQAGYAPSVSCPPDGCPFGNLCHNPAFGLSGLCVSTASGLLGVFLDSDRPDTTPAPPTLNLNSPAALAFHTLAPQLKQLFIIGDGRAPDGTVQQFIPPTGTTRLFLGTSDGTGWFNNVGGFVATLSQAPPCSADFNGDGDIGTDADIEAFFACLGGSCCATCPPDADFNGDGDIGTDADIEAFFRVLAGAAC